MGGFLVDYAKSGRSKCKACKETIEKDSVRLGRTIDESGGREYEMTMWYHLTCMTKKQAEGALGKHGSGAGTPGVSDLSEPDCVVVAAAIESIAGGMPAAQALSQPLAGPPAKPKAPTKPRTAKTPKKRAAKEEDEELAEEESAAEEEEQVVHVTPRPRSQRAKKEKGVARDFVAHDPDSEEEGVEPPPKKSKAKKVLMEPHGGTE